LVGRRGEAPLYLLGIVEPGCRAAERRPPQNLTPRQRAMTARQLVRLHRKYIHS
jgi:hypothetical protein